MGFSAEQEQALAAKLDGRAIHERMHAGQTLSYIEGWYAIAEANRLFDFAGWDRETVSLRCVWEGLRQGRSACAYIAQVRIRVRAGDTLVCHDGHGSGIGVGASPGEAHETAVKEAETDATKRALVTFGNPFGLCLYDKEQKQVRRACRKPESHRVADTIGHRGGKRLEALQEQAKAIVPAALRPSRVRDKAHLPRVAQQPYLVSAGRLPKSITSPIDRLSTFHTSEQRIVAPLIKSLWLAQAHPNSFAFSRI